MDESSTSFLENVPLGARVAYEDKYNPGLLFPIPRRRFHEELGLTGKLPFEGVDIWNGFELSWLGAGGKPCVGIVEIWLPSDSPNLIESKSLKLYLNSFNQSSFESMAEVREMMGKDLSRVANAPVEVRILGLEEVRKRGLVGPAGECLDGLEVKIEDYKPNPGLLRVGEEVVEETVYSDLLKSNCLVTGQPDWATVQVSYSGPAICREGLLKYLVSFRQHCGFHEVCVEQIFRDILEQCSCEKLTVFARYTRRGGLDINPFRSNFEGWPENLRFVRQ